MDSASQISLHCTLKEAQKLTNEIALKKVVQANALKQRQTFTSISRKLGMNKDFVFLAFKQPPRIHFLLALSGHLDINLIQPYERFLPEHLQTSPRELLLQGEIDRLTRELEDSNLQLSLLKEVMKGK